MITVIEELVSPVLHNKAPVAAVVKIEVPQLFATVICGVATTPGSVVLPVTIVEHPLASVTVKLYAPADTV